MVKNDPSVAWVNLVGGSPFIIMPVTAPHIDISRFLFAMFSKLLCVNTVIATDHL